MDWLAYTDGYCERVAPGFWNEPLNALSNLAFIIAAVIMWRRVRRGPLRAKAMCAILAAIGLGSFLFHTFATVWASTADVIPILIFILFYIFAINRDILNWPAWMALLGTFAFLPYSAGLTALLIDIPFVGISSFYWTVPILIIAYGALLMRGYPNTAMGFFVGAGVLCISISIRSLDLLFCTDVPIGTHFIWHILNALMLAWMIEIYQKHAVENDGIAEDRPDS